MSRQSKVAPFIVKGKFKMEYVEDDLTDYLNQLMELFQKEKKPMLGDLATTLTGEYRKPKSGFIAPLMSTKFNPYLYLSGQLNYYWDYQIDSETKGKSSVEVLYSGMGLHDFYGVGEAKVWWEFATDDSFGKPIREKELERDYAWYQETGEDPIARPEFAKHKGAVRKGLEASEPKLIQDTQRYLNNIMQLKPANNAMWGMRYHPKYKSNFR